MIPADQIDVDAVKASRQGTPTPGALARLGRQFPGSWLAFGQEQIVRCADPHFRLLASTSGRLDYTRRSASGTRGSGRRASERRY